MSLTVLLRPRPLFNHIFVSYRLIHGSNSLPVPPNLNVLETPEDTDKARSWVTKFKDVSIPRSHVELHFARSSGPGGQNVNKVNTKAVIKCSLNSSWIPAWARAELIRSPYYVSSSHSIQLSSTVTRSQAQNVDDCLAKLHNSILVASSASIKTEPSEQQKKKVERLQQAEKVKRKSEKMYRSDVKRGRSSRDWF
ncbi:hypothetical protein P691DRAFT_790537 [Macrolepiota fuliginosa MF-IS2]|uniref:Prokaryotic-type class I peptide chain release factors domain-containing protein n=1 Tax=Macrolepiota fuliginosa MF-IS2 TaxID=1400762 RepID=A0A9P5XHB2_9AGAR|nr:hypothetical protein P691DRAFT_790537 [Macrolepiota fuliginosa MF-IS2]